MSNCPHRRHFLKHLAGSATLALGGLPFMHKLAAAPAQNKKHKSIIILWMGGGPSHMDIWTIKTGSANQGSFNALKTSADGIEISEAMPKMAEQMKHVVRIESLNSQEVDHGRGAIRMNTGFPPNIRTGCVTTVAGNTVASIKIPHLGSIVSHYVGYADDWPLPFISVGGTATRIGAGFLGTAYAPFPVQKPGTVPENLRLPQWGDDAQTMDRVNRRKDVLGLLEDNFRGAVAPHLTKEEDRKAFADASQEHAELVDKALDVSLKAGKMFEFGSEDNKLLAEYGNNGFGRGCLLARKLVEAGVSAVQVDLGGWNMHGNIAAGIRRNATGILDPAFAALIKDLNQRGLYKDTLVVWMGEFGRTPRINPSGGRDPWSNGWTIVLGGAGLKQGISYGETDKDGEVITKNPVGVHQLYATMYTALGIDLKDRNLDLHDNFGVRFYLAGDKENVEPIKALLA